ncbi:metal-dependent hydrolase [uncultured Pseudacidovorax sp.]|uniref:metal-dependent hydrolase n=1 Tax=uncultured Pseudacidovorax sp. TaxID=679313 RepID=UPI0025D38369|nr:metal-dependent hydrolase [uncultured Pseudacidovorax sp.]
MDSLTQIVLGAAVAAVSVPARDRRVALAAGAVLGTLPDLDGIPLALMGLDPVTRVTWHRGPSHSLPLLLAAGWLLWLLLRRWNQRVRTAPRPWLVAIWLALLTHPLLDAFTVYGTQLWWPSPTRPVMGGSMFIIDPLYTLPLLAACIAAAVAGPRAWGRRWLAGGLLLGSLYLGWSLVGQQLADRAAARALAPMGLRDAPRLVVATPLNTLLWRVVVMTPDGFLEGERSLVADRGAMRFTAHASDTAALQALGADPAVARLRWFTHGFMKAERDGDALVVSDLRMGAEPDYSFNYRVARWADGRWQPVPVRQQSGIRDAKGMLAATWQRIWHAAPAP